MPPIGAQNTQTAHLNNWVELWTIPTVLAPGHPLRGERCGICGMLIGGRPIRIVTITGLEMSEAHAPGLICHAAAICAEHEPDGHGTVANQIVAAATEWHRRQRP